MRPICEPGAAAFRRSIGEAGAAGFAAPMEADMDQLYAITRPDAVPLLDFAKTYEELVVLHSGPYHPDDIVMWEFDEMIRPQDCRHGV